MEYSAGLTSKLFWLERVQKNSRLFFEFLHEVYDEKIQLGGKETTD